MAKVDRRYMSRPLLKLLQTCDVAPVAVQEAVARQAGDRGYAVLRAGHPYISRIRNATGLDVTEIAWRYGRLLVSIEQITDGQIKWFYREVRGSYCSFRYRVELPQTVISSLRGRTLGALTDTIAPLVDVEIADVDESYASTEQLSLKLAPDWIPF